MKHITPREAHDFLLEHPEAVFVDCRSEAEFFLVGHPIVERPGAEPLRPHNICWSDELKLETNEHFVDDVTKVAPDPGKPTLLICRRAGGRWWPGGAGGAGWTDVYNVLEGFEGRWTRSGSGGRRRGGGRRGCRGSSCSYLARSAAAPQ
jgi:rhodanese-related sulfurtransferase